MTDQAAEQAAGIAAQTVDTRGWREICEARGVTHIHAHEQAAAVGKQRVDKAQAARESREKLAIAIDVPDIGLVPKGYVERVRYSISESTRTAQRHMNDRMARELETARWMVAQGGRTQ